MWWRVLGADIRRRRGLTDFFHTSGFLQGVILASSGECSGSRLAIYYQCLHKWIGDIKHDSNFLPVYFFGYRYPQILINFIQSFKIAVTLYAFPELAFHINISQHRDMYPHSRYVSTLASQPSGLFSASLSVQLCPVWAPRERKHGTYRSCSFSLLSSLFILRLPPSQY